MHDVAKRWTAEALLAALEGVWQLDRRIVDRAARQGGAFTGEARFTPAAYGLTYEEDGTLRLGNAPPLRATRRYLWAEKARRVVVLFERGAPFHDFDPADASCAAEHICPPDTYRVRYAFSGWPRWSTIWEVAGPRKDYRMESHYARVSQPSLRP